MSANDILDVLNIQRDAAQQPQKKKQKVEQPILQKGGMARELYNLLGPNTPPVSMNMGNSRIKDRWQKVSPWSRMPFVPNKSRGTSATFYHWQKGSKELLEASNADKIYAFDKFLVSIDIPEMVDESTFDNIMAEIKEREAELAKERKARAERVAKEKEEHEAKLRDETDKKQAAAAAKRDVGADSKSTDASGVTKTAPASDPDNSTRAGSDGKQIATASGPNAGVKSSETSSATATISSSMADSQTAEESEEEPARDWTYEETALLFQFCKDFELKWHVINDRFPAKYGRSMEDLKEQFYRVCAKVLKYKGTGNPNLLESLDAFSKTAEIDRKQYLENLLKRTPAEIAEEESLVIEARRFELAAKKMLAERANLLTLLDSPQSSQSVQQYQSSQGLTNLYNNLMILDKHQKKKSQQKAAQAPTEPVPPPIPSAASSSHKRDRSFQTHLQNYLAGVLKQQPAQSKGEPSPIQQLLSKRLTTKEEEAYGLHYHENERLTPNVILRSSQKLAGLQQRQSVFKAVNSMLQELDIPTSGGTTWKPNMPTRKTMAKYDEMIKTVVALLEVKKGKDKLEAEIELIKSQRGLQ